MPEPQVITEVYQGRAKITFSPGRHTYSVRVHGHADRMFQPSVTGILGSKAKPALTGWAAKKSLAYVEKKLGEYESTQNAPPFTVNTKEIHSWLAEAADGWNEDPATSIGSLAHRLLHTELSYRTGLIPNPPRLPIVVDPVLAPEYTEAMVEAANNSVQAGIQFFNEHKIRPVFMERVLWSPSEGYVGTTDGIGYIDGELAVWDLKTSKKLYPEYRMQLAAYAKMYHEEFRVLPMVRYAINTKKDGGLEVERYDIDTYQEDLDAFNACFTLYQFDRAKDAYKKGSPIQVLGNIDNLVARPTQTS